MLAINIIILSLIGIGLIIHRYLSTFWEQGRLRYSMGFTLFANGFAVLYLINYIWMFGFIVGIIFSILSFSQIIYSSYLWIFQLPWLIKLNKNKKAIPEPNQFVYATWSQLVPILLLLTIVNFFVSDFASLSVVQNYFTKGKWLLILILTMGLGNIIRVNVLKKYLETVNKREPKNKSS